MKSSPGLVAECGSITDSSELPGDVLQFIAEKIESVPHLEALLLVHGQPGEHWTVDRIASRLYVSPEAALRVMRDLEQHKLVRRRPEGAASEFAYDPDWDASRGLMAKVATTYTRHLAAVATFIHRKAPRSVREFARAFEVKKD